MSRFHYWQFLINKEGQPIPDANINVYLAGTDTSAYVYFDEFGSNTSNEEPQVITNNMGYFEFWVADASEAYGYQKGQKFKIEWEKPGVALGKIDWVDIFPHVVEVDETDVTSTAKNKVISNKLAYRWEEHKNSTLQNDGFPIHGIEAVNEVDEDIFPNKVISNKLAKKWDSHSTFSFETSATSATAAHDLQPININSQDTIFNKLINNKILFDINESIITINELLESGIGNAGNIFISHSLSDTWILTHNFGVKYVAVTIFGTDDLEIKPKSIELTNLNTVTVLFDESIEGYAVITGNVVEGGPSIPPFVIEGDHGSLTGLGSDDHTIYPLVNGSRGFTNPISGSMPISGDHLTTKEYVDYEINNILIDHSRLSNPSIGDDHLQYIHIDSRRGFTNPIIGKSPIEFNHLATKEYVDNNTILSHTDLQNKDYDDHLQYIHIDGRRGFTHNISGIIPIAPTHLVTKEYVDQNIVSKYDINISSWDFNGINYFKNINHNLSENYPIVMIWDQISREIINPIKIESIDDNNIIITVSTNNNMIIKVRT